MANKKDNIMNQSNISRRDFFKFVGLSSLTVGIIPLNLSAATVSEIIVVGGGFAGATCAKYLKLWGGTSINVTIIEPNENYVSPILSNLVINGQKNLTDITFNYLSHASNYKINMVHKSVASIDKVNKTIVLDDGSRFSYDYLVLAPGIDFIFPSGQDISKIPHGWVAGEQTALLKTQIDTMVDGDEFVMSIPASPYRCPPGPYERACVVADYLKNAKGYSNCKITVLDANSDIIVEKDTFQEAFISYGVTYIPNANIVSVDSDAKSVIYNTGADNVTKNATVLNIIPNQKAPQIIFDTGLNNSGETWASVDAISYESTIANDIFIIGDAQNTVQPKAGHIANSEAKICADAILRKIDGLSPYPTPKTNSACYSPISRTQASWLTAVYEYDSGTKNMKLVAAGNYPTSGAPSTKNYSDMFGWSTNLFRDTFY